MTLFARLLLLLLIEVVVVLLLDDVAAEEGKGDFVEQEGDLRSREVIFLDEFSVTETGDVTAVTAGRGWTIFSSVVATSSSQEMRGHEVQLSADLTKSLVCGVNDVAEDEHVNNFFGPVFHYKSTRYSVKGIETIKLIKLILPSLLNASIGEVDSSTILMTS